MAAEYSSSIIDDIDEAETQLRDSLQDVGVDVFNQQHIQLLEICISFQKTLAPYKETDLPETEWDKINRLLDQLDHYTKDHLKEEEEALKASDFPELDLNIHIKAHDIFREMVQEYKAYAAKRDRAKVAKLGFNLFDWFFWHINDMDAKYKDYIGQ